MITSRFMRLIVTLGVCLSFGLPANAAKLGLKASSASVNTGDNVTFTVTVDGAVPTADQIATISLSEDSASTARFSTPQTFAVANGQASQSLASQSYGSASFVAKSSSTDLTDSDPVTVDVNPKVVLVFPENTLSKGDTRLASVKIDGHPSTAAEDQKITYSSSDSNVLAVDQKSGSLSAAGPGVASLKAEYTGGPISVTTDPVIVTVAPAASGTGDIECHIYPIDNVDTGKRFVVAPNDTASASFGHEISDHYIIEKLTIQNRDSQHRDIIVYGDSLTAWVTLTEEPTKAVQVTHPDASSRNWPTITDADYARLFENSRSPYDLVDLSADDATNLHYVIVNPGNQRAFGVVNVPKALQAYPLAWSSNADAIASVNPNTGLVTSVSPGYATISVSANGTQLAAWIVFVPDPTSTAPHVFGWQPIGSKLILDSAFVRFDRAREVGWGNILTTAGSLGSFLITARGISNKATTFFTAYNGLLVPGLDKLFASHRDQEQSTLRNDIIQPVEQLAYGAILTKYLFFPSGAFTGLIPNTKTRIGSVNTDGASISIAYITESKTVTSK